MSNGKKKVILVFAYEEYRSVDQALWVAQIHRPIIGSHKIFVVEEEIPWPSGKENLLSPYNEIVIDYLEKHGCCSIKNISKETDLPVKKVKEVIDFLKRFKRLKETRKGVYKILF